MTNKPLTDRPEVVYDYIWNQLSEKEKRILAYWVRYMDEYLSIRGIKGEACLRSLHASELTALNAKLARLNSGLRISCRKEEESNRITWKLEKK